MHDGPGEQTLCKRRFDLYLVFALRMSRAWSAVERVKDSHIWLSFFVFDL